VTAIGDLFAEIRVVNVGIESFALELAQLGVAVIHVQWAPPANGDPRRATLLAQLADTDEPDARGDQAHGCSATPMSPKGEEALPPNLCESHSSEINR
jgi:hypothetical protein